MTWWHFIYLHLMQWAGSNSASRAYNIQSGVIGNAIGVLGLSGMLTGVYMFIRKHNCHVHGCWSVRSHPVPGTPYHACKKHNPHIPDGKITADLIEEAAGKV